MGSWLVRLVLLLLAVSGTSLSSVTPSLLNRWGNQFYVPSSSTVAPVAKYNCKPPINESCVNGDTLIPFTVFVSNETVVTGEVLEDLVANYLEDDVYIDGFLNGIQIFVSEGSIFQESAIDYLKSLNISYLLLSTSFSAHSTIIESIQSSSFETIFFQNDNVAVPGPYIGKLAPSGQLSLSKVYGLFFDTEEALMHGAIAADEGSFAYSGLYDPIQHGSLIPFQSKLYYSLMDTEQYPLAGLRFVCKYLFEIKGLVIRGGSREMLRLYPDPRNETAPSIQALIHLGAVLVGMSKLTTFAYGAYAYQTMDFQYSWNPRGDGFLGLSADLLLLLRHMMPSTSPLRPTWGTIDTDKVIPSASSLDTVGFFTRSPSLMEKIAKAWDTSSNPKLIQDNFSLPKKIIYHMEWFPVNNSVAQTLIDSWLVNVTTALGMTIEYQNVTTLFLENVDQSNTLATFTADIGTLTDHDNWHLFGEKFIADYAAKYDGRYPEFDIQVTTAWAAAVNYSAEEAQFNEGRKARFAEFFNANVIPYNNKTCTEGFRIYQIEDTGGGVPEYRDVLNYDYFPPFLPMRAASIAPFASLVDVTVPIGQIPYDSVISKRVEELAITLNFVAHQGCDFVLMDFLAACAAAGFCKEVKTGRTAF
ncbi:hypothetical protein N431DRAFT_471346 [Stipitochalara longipes BDJ]|nr:hypothetical protein N431DRAFT_471346 [Stipitochalara longipes BDJ]